MQSAQYGNEMGTAELCARGLLVLEDLNLAEDIYRLLKPACGFVLKASPPTSE